MTDAELVARLRARARDSYQAAGLCDDEEEDLAGRLRAEAALLQEAADRLVARGEEGAPMNCTYCQRDLDDSPESDTYQAIEGWETVDRTSSLRWVHRDVFACGACVEEHFVHDVDHVDEV